MNDSPHTNIPTTLPSCLGKKWAMSALIVSLSLHAVIAAIIMANLGATGSSTKLPPEIMIQNIVLASPQKTEISAAPPADTAQTLPSDKHDSAAAQDMPASTESTTDTTSLSEAEKIFATSSLGMGMMHGYFSSIADGKSLREDIREYYFEVVEKINREWWKKAGDIKEQMRQDGFVEVRILRDGSLLSIRTLQKTGSRDADDLLEHVVHATAPFPPLPRTFDQDIFQIPLRVKAPTSLFRITP